MDRFPMAKKNAIYFRCSFCDGMDSLCLNIDLTGSLILYKAFKTCLFQMDINVS